MGNHVAKAGTEGSNPSLSSQKSQATSAPYGADTEHVQCKLTRHSHDPALDPAPPSVADPVSASEADGAENPVSSRAPSPALAGLLDNVRVYPTISNGVVGWWCEVFSEALAGAVSRDMLYAAGPFRGPRGAWLAREAALGYIAHGDLLDQSDDPPEMDDPLEALWGAALPTTTHVALETFLLDYERHWNGVAEDSALEPVTVALCKHLMDQCLCEIFAMLRGFLTQGHASRGVFERLSRSVGIRWNALLGDSLLTRMTVAVCREVARRNICQVFAALPKVLS
ncbi:MAG: hypothetical protein PHR30_18445 [Gallionellaceae bacterium]|nr:hypothetical protein [Gallionellaceae bacterium]